VKECENNGRLFLGTLMQQLPALRITASSDGRGCELYLRNVGSNASLRNLRSPSVRNHFARIRLAAVLCDKSK
jgi:hypothetical protein